MTPSRPLNNWLSERALSVEVAVLDRPEGDVIASGLTLGDPIGEFFVGADGRVYFRAVGDSDAVWAGPDPESFRRIAAAWGRYRADVRALTLEAAQIALVGQMQRELAQLGALPSDLPPDPEPLWSLLLFEAENGLG